MSITINDIAKIAKVSPSTVSRVIANNPRISEETRKRVLKIMEEYNYHPNFIARSLVNKSTKIIGVIVPSAAEKAFQHPFYPEILRGIASSANSLGYNILISNTECTDMEIRNINQFVRGGITEGLIFLTSRLKDPSIAQAVKLGFPFVVVGRPENDIEINWVDNNNLTVSYELTKYLISKGHKTISFVGYSNEYIVTVDRLNGFLKAIQENDLEVDKELIIEGDFIQNGVYPYIEKLKRRKKFPTAIIACDDLQAFSIIKALNDNGVNVPRDVAIAGFNNVPLSEYFTPALTSVDVNAFQLGVKAFELLYKSIKSETKTYERVIIPAKIVHRSSI